MTYDDTATYAGNTPAVNTSTVAVGLGNTGPMRPAWEPTARAPQDRLPKKNGQPRQKPRRRR